MQVVSGNLSETSECPVCLGIHEEEVHHATVAVHRWLRSEIARRTDPQPQPAPILPDAPAQFEQDYSAALHPLLT